MISIRCPFDSITDALDVGDISRPPFDQIPGLHGPILADRQSKLARRVDGEGCHATLVSYQGFVAVPCPRVPDANVPVLASTEQVGVFEELQAGDCSC